ncbi:uncharacterized protein LAESUDRAFT_760511 [Laetiporus sulphureus 93-53]|uniref:Uncharacterized protein n=1 Tax=Laetiporus sulphureus 93-53 TaxID=1314785 RepID=A0A165DJY5_9APHY|nr:uncharacterized protein LAESUDRAFT_760511 [Laetiporus sulphureus 93-53]KZT05048.1 hypothetical protein LAESUDRAFT_760511 [Laetiporus sulphureus 93-53]
MSRASPNCTTLDHSFTEHRRNTIPIQGNATDRDSLRAIADATKLPKLGKASITEYRKLLLDYKMDETFAKTFKMNVAGVQFCAEAFLELLRKATSVS